jgi:tetratricopeptide (TPR) repeat protein
MDPVTEVSTLRELLQQQRIDEMLAAARSILASRPDQRDALLFQAIAQRMLGRIPEALQTLQLLQGHYPGFSRLHEERGRCFVALRQAPPAIAAFREAVRLNYALPGSWSMLEGLYRMQGDTQNVAIAASNLNALRSLPQPVVVATGLFADGELEAAEALTRRYLLEQGNHIEAMRLLARIGIAHKIYFDAQVLLAAVLEREPAYRAARQEYAFVLIELHRFEEAARELQALLADEPDNRELRVLQAAAAVGVGEHEQALTLYRKLLRDSPEDADAHLSIGHALKTLGQTQPAIESYRRAAESRPDFGDAYWSLANLKTYRFADAELTQMKTVAQAESTALVDRYHLCFAIGKALEDQAQFAESFRFYQLGNELKRPECRYRAQMIERNTQHQIEVCTPALFAARTGWGDPAPDPIFIVGLPRSGSTLLEQILASHSQVEGTQELPNVQQIVSRLRGFGPEEDDPRYPRILATATAEDFATLGQEYLAGTRVYRGRTSAPAPPFFIDKMPNNFRHLGLLHLMLPNARIIDARREPMACCFSNFKQLFANGQEFTYSIEDIARYYRTYLELMRHWDQVFPGRVLRVFHEDVVDDLEGNVRRLLAFCGLDFEQQCIDFHQTKRSVRTASSEQVRQGIYRDGLDQWKNFEPWLGPLQEALGDALQRYRE